MLPSFNEKAFLYALTSRPEDAKRFSLLFRPEWLRSVELQPLLAEVYSFTKKHGTPPSLTTLDTLFKDKDAEAWDLRYREVIEDLRRENPDLSECLYVLGKAKDAAIVRSFQSLETDHDFMKLQSEFDGTRVLTEVTKWLNLFAGQADEESANIKEAIESLVSASHEISERIPIGLNVIDEWTDGGLRPKQLGIFMAATGKGKSSVLVNAAYNVAEIMDKSCWLITNELTMHEQTERFLARMTGKNLSQIQNDPAIAYSNLEKHWKDGLHDRLRITSVNRNISANDIDGMLVRWAQISGWKPAVLVLDYMERMRPNETGYDRNKEWTWLGAIAQDLVQLAKRHNLVIWTACQTNRSGLMEGVDMSMSMGQASIKHFQEAACVIAMTQTQVKSKYGEEVSIGIEFTGLKFRHSKLANRKAVVHVNLATMLISNDKAERAVKENAPTKTDDEGEPGDEKPKWQNPGRDKKKKS
jgi:replicative DNA helicase